jgi:outer membrane lipoprotein SlyB
MVLVCSMSGLAYCADNVDDNGGEESGKDNGNQALTGAIVGGLLGAGLGAGIGSAVGHAGTGTAIGGGAGAVGGALIGANQESGSSGAKKRSKGKVVVSKDEKVRKKIIREYDEKGNVVSEKEIKD